MKNNLSLVDFIRSWGHEIHQNMISRKWQLLCFIPMILFRCKPDRSIIYDLEEVYTVVLTIQQNTTSPPLLQFPWKQVALLLSVRRSSFLWPFLSHFNHKFSIPQVFVHSHSCIAALFTDYNLQSDSIVLQNLLNKMLYLGTYLTSFTVC